MKSLLLSLLAGLVLMTSTSCFEILEKIVVKKDGSGTYDMIMDMGPMLAMMSAMGGDEEEDEEQEYEQWDSTFYYSESPDSIKALWSNPTVMEKAYVNVHMDEENYEMNMTIHADFSKVADLMDFERDIAHIGNGGSFFNGMNTDDEGNPVADDESARGKPVEYAMKNGVFSRGKYDLGEMGKFDKDERQLMATMLDGGSVTVEITLPETIKKSSNKKYKVKGNKATAEVSLMEYMDGKAKLETELKY